MSDIGDCTVTEVDSLDAFEVSEELEELFSAIETANKTNFFRAVIEFSVINNIPTTKENNRLNQIVFSGKMELIGSPKAWKELDALSKAEESIDIDQSKAISAREDDEENIVPMEIDISSKEMLDLSNEVVAKIAYVSKETISTLVRLQASGYDANNHLLGSHTWVIVPSQNKEKSA
ncbi:MAG TPA: hypothetical protein VGM34_01805 [Chlamydiales bacterium]|jgi:hypothetical protein